MYVDFDASINGECTNDHYLMMGLICKRGELVPSMAPSRTLHPSISQSPTTSQPRCALGTTLLYSGVVYDYEVTVGNGGRFTQKRADEQVDVGSFTEIVDNVAYFEGGDLCPNSIARSATVTFIEDCTATEIVVVEVIEPQTCVYKATARGSCGICTLP